MNRYDDALNYMTVALLLLPILMCACNPDSQRAATGPVAGASVISGKLENVDCQKPEDCIVVVYWMKKQNLPGWHRGLSISPHRLYETAVGPNGGFVFPRADVSIMQGEAPVLGFVVRILVLQPGAVVSHHKKNIALDPSGASVNMDLGNLLVSIEEGAENKSPHNYHYYELSRLVGRMAKSNDCTLANIPMTLKYLLNAANKLDGEVEVQHKYFHESELSHIKECE